MPGDKHANRAKATYSGPAQVIHWVTLALLAWSVWLAWGMVELELSLEKFAQYNLHKSLGVTIWVLTVLRLIWRRVSPPPPLPATMPDWQRRAAGVSHALLYALLLIQPLIGIVHSWSADFPIVIFGQVTLPNPMGPNKALQDSLGLLHAWLGWSLVALIGLHAAAAIKHQVIDKDNLLARMIPFLPTKKRS